MNRDTIVDELRRLEGEVVEAERELAEQEALLVRLKRERQDVSRVATGKALQEMQAHMQRKD